MTVFGISSEDHTHGCNKVCALVNQGADAVGRGFRQVKGMFVQESLRSEMGRVYNEGYKLSPELVEKVMGLLAVVLGTIPLAMTVMGGYRNGCMSYLCRSAYLYALPS